MRKSSYGIVPIVALAAHTGFAQQAPRTEEEHRAVAIADAYVEKTLPRFKLEAMERIIFDRGQAWEVTYIFRIPRPGGEPHIFVSKSSHQVVDSLLTQ